MGSTKTADTVTPNHDTSSGVQRRVSWSEHRRLNTIRVYHSCPVEQIPLRREEVKTLKLYPQKGGNGFVSCYLAPIGSREAKRVGFVREDGTSRILKKQIDESAQTITISINHDAEDQSNES